MPIGERTEPTDPSLSVTPGTRKRGKEATSGWPMPTPKGAPNSPAATNLKSSPVRGDRWRTRTVPGSTRASPRRCWKTKRTRKGKRRRATWKSGRVAKSAEILGLQATGTGHRRNGGVGRTRSEEHTSELQSRGQLVCRLLLEKKK